MGSALKDIDAQFSSEDESSANILDILTKLMDVAPAPGDCVTLKAAWLNTKLGSMIAIADDRGLYLLEFANRRHLESEVKRLKKKLKASIILGVNEIIKNIEKELADYLDNKQFTFNTPLHFVGSDFQKKVWHELSKIPAGETRSYLDIAKAINAPKSYRAVAQANGSNQLILIIPCHRVVNTNGELGGYSSGIDRKQWLLEHEKNNK